MESLGKYTTYMKQTICHVYLSLTNGVIIEIFMCIAGNICVNCLKYNDDC